MILMKVKLTNDKSKMILGSSKLFYYNPVNNNYDNADITFFASKAIGFFTSYSSHLVFGLDDVDVLDGTRSSLITEHSRHFQEFAPDNPIHSKVRLSLNVFWTKLPDLLHFRFWLAGAFLPFCSVTLEVLSATNKPRLQNG